jgi:EAL domain-containing protein (putative c-di-GMP-specific phosphodiesterase class I)
MEGVVPSQTAAVSGAQRGTREPTSRRYTLAGLLEVSGGAEVGEVIGQLVRLARRELGMAVAFVAELHGAVGHVRFLADGRDNDSVVEPVLPLGAPLSELVAGGAPCVVPDATVDARVRHLPVTARLGIGAYLAVPLRLSDGRLYGVLGCFKHAPDPGLGELEARFLRVLATLVSEQLERSEGVAGTAEREARIGRVLAGEGLETMFQPIVDLRTGAVVGLEALTRFSIPPLRGPDVWFGEAHALGLGVELELVAARAALAHAGSVPPGTYLSVNVSPPALCSPAFLDLLPSLPAEHLVIELTEHAPVEDYGALGQQLGTLRARGGRIAVDDAGAGFSCLRHILRLEPDFIKLDVSLTQGIDQNRSLRALASALRHFAADTHSTIVAEGVERPEETRALLALGVRYAQGYHLGAPAPASIRLGVPPADGQAARRPEDILVSPA